MKYTHKAVRQLLYEYLSGEINDQVRSEVARHLGECTHCAGELEQLKQVLHSLPGPVSRPSARRTDEFWSTFVSRVEQRIGQKRGIRSVPVFDVLRSWLSFHRPAVATTGLAVAAAGIVASLVLMKVPDVRQPREQIVEQLPAVDEQSERVGQYFRRSKSLLIGLANKKSPEGMPVDLSLERQVSRQLVEEARQLREQPLDPGATQLMGEMERILIELANAENNDVRSNMDLLRSGIREENLLFKVRMAEAVYGTPTFMNASYRK